MSDQVSFPFNTPEESSGYLLWQVTMLWQRTMKRELDKLDITHTQFVLMSALGWLSKEESNVTQIDIANHSNTDRMMVSKVLRTLEEKKVIKRKDHPVDTRAKVITLTPSGVELLQKALKVVEEVDNTFFNVLGPYRPIVDLNLKSLFENHNHSESTSTNDEK
ncbi:MarR family winged helix-turn-helix transcriptional regulator [Myroides odoratimimus]|uniref:MarR family winged helix-turn-helix transcriptional regulator n=1 Tax=Myroides odoratimimus TaxID=76832 RepID=UPI001CE0D1BB|nr:MarR family transcriptional regulator [Myroides odoratimimus]MCA4806884.1 MarR family transcriptional regulator [Myroides odoratimimus]MDM1530336.1 MarR family transcriptional regulator [Myroides odoratimimus]